MFNKRKKKTFRTFKKMKINQLKLHSTLKYLSKSLNNKTKKLKTARNIVNLITTEWKMI